MNFEECLAKPESYQYTLSTKLSHSTTCTHFPYFAAHFPIQLPIPKFKPIPYLPSQPPIQSPFPLTQPPIPSTHFPHLAAHFPTQLPISFLSHPSPYLATYPPELATHPSTKIYASLHIDQPRMYYKREFQQVFGAQFKTLTLL